MGFKQKSKMSGSGLQNLDNFSNFNKKGLSPLKVHEPGHNDNVEKKVLENTIELDPGKNYQKISRQSAKKYWDEVKRINTYKENLNNIINDNSDGNPNTGSNARRDEQYEGQPQQERGLIQGQGMIPDKLVNWIKMAEVTDGVDSATCNTYSCSMMRAAGATIPEGIEEFKVNNRTYRPGDKIPIIPGNRQFDQYYEKMGFTLNPNDSKPKAGDLGRIGYAGIDGSGLNPYEELDGSISRSDTSHSVIYGKDTDKGKNYRLQNYYNPGDRREGYKENVYYTYNENVNAGYKPNLGDRTMSYTGNLTGYKKKMLEDRKNASDNMPVLKPANIKKTDIKFSPELMKMNKIKAPEKRLKDLKRRLAIMKSLGRK